MSVPVWFVCRSSSAFSNEDEAAAHLDTARRIDPSFEMIGPYKGIDHRGLRTSWTVGRKFKFFTSEDEAGKHEREEYNAGMSVYVHGPCKFDKLPDDKPVTKPVLAPAITPTSVWIAGSDLWWHSDKESGNLRCKEKIKATGCIYELVGPFARPSFPWLSGCQISLHDTKKGAAKRELEVRGPVQLDPSIKVMEFPIEIRTPTVPAPTPAPAPEYEPTPDYVPMWNTYCEPSKGPNAGPATPITSRSYHNTEAEAIAEAKRLSLNYRVPVTIHRKVHVVHPPVNEATVTTIPA